MHSSPGPIFIFFLLSSNVVDRRHEEPRFTVWHVSHPPALQPLSHDCRTVLQSRRRSDGRPAVTTRAGRGVVMSGRATLASVMGTNINFQSFSNAVSNPCISDMLIIFLRSRHIQHAQKKAQNIYARGSFGLDVELRQYTPSLSRSDRSQVRAVLCNVHTYRDGGADRPDPG